MLMARQDDDDDDDDDDEKVIKIMHYCFLIFFRAL